MMKVDDGFAGGVCRCSTCGTIQTVPKKGDPATHASTPGTVIYERASREAVNKELEALGDVVTSSGIVGSGMLQHSKRRAKPAVPIGKWIGIGLGALLALAALWFGLREASDHETVSVVTPADPSVKNKIAPMTTGPRFGPIVLDRTGTIVYLLDRGDATRPFTAPLQAAVLKSIATLEPARRFQIRYWSSGGESPAFPLTPGEPSAFNRNKAATWMNEVPGGQSTDATESLDAALSQKPSEIVLVTGKAWQLDESFTNEAVVKLTGKAVRIHVVSLGNGTGEDSLARLASKTGGIHLPLTANELQQLGQ